MKKVLIIIGAVLGILILGTAVYLSFFAKPAVLPQPNTNLSDKPIKPTPTPPIPNSVRIVLKTASGDVQVNNFYAKAVKIIEADVFLQDNNLYSILYSSQANDFLIDIYANSTPQAQTIRNSAETVFLNTLGISQDDSCKLKVHTRVPASYDPDLASLDYHLSFCPDGIQF